MQQFFNSRALILTLRALNFNINLQTLWPILLAYTNDWWVLALFIALLHIIHTDFQNYDIYYYDLLIIGIYFLSHDYFILTYIKIFYLIVLAFFVLIHSLGFGDLLLIAIIIPFLNDLEVIFFLLNATLLALVLNKTRHQSYLPFGPCLVLSLLIIHPF